MTRVKARAQRISADKAHVEREMRALDSQRGQQMSLLRRIAPDVVRGLEWIEQNRNQFKKDVFGPPAVTCSIKDQRYSDLVQSLFQNDDYLCFTTQSVDDHRLLSKQFYGEMGLSVTIRTCTTPLSSFRPPVGPEHMAAMGFEGTAIDYLDGPEPVLAMLCIERRLHASPVSVNQPRQDQYNMVVANDNIGTWVSKDQMYRINRRREYGAHAVSTTVRDVRPGRFWNAAQADLSEKADLQKKLDQGNDELRTLQEEMRALKEQLAVPTQQSAEVDAEIVGLRVPVPVPACWTAARVCR